MKFIKIFLIGILFLTIYNSTFAAEEVSKQFIEPKDAYTVGDTIVYSVIIKLADGESYTLEKPVLPENLEQISLTDDRKDDTVTIEGKFRLFDPAIKQMPDLIMNIEKGTKKTKLTITGLPYSTDSVLTDEDKDIADIEPPKKGLKTDYTPLPLILLLLGVAILIGVIYWLYRKWKMRPKKDKPLEIWEQPIDPLEYFTEEWSKQSIARAIETHTEKRLYYSVTEIVRIFLSLRYRKNYIDMTTTEFSRLFNEYIPTALKKDVLDFLVFADAVKFARYSPTDDEVWKIKDIMTTILAYYTHEEQRGAEEKK